ncbi:MAG: Spx/MgsR family RNA polymerase-binding regulatory protein [Acidobacteria bacterium]|nr:Spx/MgsR family RNA polymerase-binding regulatory protein [Acidobacteriota bacterium]
MKDITFYWLPNCSTCRKAKSYIERHGIRNFPLRDIKDEPLTREEIVELTKMLGGAEGLFSRRAVRYRELKLNERELSDAEMLDLMVEDYTFLKRPVLVIDGRAIAGYFEKFWSQFLEENYYQ